MTTLAPKPCDNCGASGKSPRDPQQDCAKCQGSGSFTPTREATPAEWREALRPDTPAEWREARRREQEAP